MSGKKQSAVVTGASTGIGLALVTLLAEKGWRVFGTVRKESDAAKLRALSPNITPLLADVTDEKQVEAAMAQVATAVGEDGLDVLVNNAGFGKTGPLEFMPMTEFVKQFDVNVFGVVVMLQHGVPLLRKGSPGRVINVGSIAAESTAPYWGAYNATKSALQALSECLRRELAPFGMKVSCIQPGPVTTNFEETMRAEIDKLQQQFPTGSKSREYYGSHIDYLPKTFEKITQGSVSAEFVAKRIYSLMTAKSPKNITHDTWRSWFLTFLLRWLPVSTKDKINADMMFPKN